MSAVGVNARLEPNPSVAVFGIWESFRDLQLHRITTRHRHINLAYTCPCGLLNGVAADISHTRTMADQIQLGSRLFHPLHHRPGRNINDSRGRKKRLQLLALNQGQVVAFHAYHSAATSDRQNRAPVIVTLPIGIGDVIAVAPAPRLCGVNPRRNSHILGGGHDKRIRTAKRAIQKARVIRDVMHRRENSGSHAVIGHDLAQALQARVIFGWRKRQHFGALMETVKLWTVCHIIDPT